MYKARIVFFGTRIWDFSEPLIKQLLEDLDNNSLPGKSQDMGKYLYNYELK